MATYKELQSQLEKLNKQAEQARLKEVAAVIDQIRSMIVEYGLLPADLGIGTTRKKRKASPVAAKYQDPETGSTWSGRGRAPKWLEGKDRSQFEVQ